MQLLTTITKSIGFVRNMFLIKHDHGKYNDMTKHIYFSTSVGF